MTNICTGAERMTTHAVEAMLARKRAELLTLRQKVDATETAIRNLTLELDRRQGELLDMFAGTGSLLDLTD